MINGSSDAVNGCESGHVCCADRPVGRIGIYVQLVGSPSKLVMYGLWNHDMQAYVASVAIGLTVRVRHLFAR